MATAAKPLPTNPYEKFRIELFEESPRAAYWLESMTFGILAQLDGMTEETALELACKIVLHDRQPPRLASDEAKTNGNTARGRK